MHWAPPQLAALAWGCCALQALRCLHVSCNHLVGIQLRGWGRAAPMGVQRGEMSSSGCCSPHPPSTAAHAPCSPGLGNARCVHVCTLVACDASSSASRTQHTRVCTRVPHVTHAPGAGRAGWKGCCSLSLPLLYTQPRSSCCAPRRTLLVISGANHLALVYYPFTAVCMEASGAAAPLPMGSWRALRDAGGNGAGRETGMGRGLCGAGPPTGPLGRGGRELPAAPGEVGKGISVP